MQAAWEDQSLVLGGRCEEPDMKGLNIPARANEDPRIWEGDNLELLIETQVHSYYQITIDPSGAVIDLDRKRGGLNATWSSGIQVAAYAGDGFWSVEMRVPLASDDAEAHDSLHGVAGRRPTANDPWYFNLYRQRVRGSSNEGCIVFPTGEGGLLHVPSKFGALIVK